MATNPAKGPGRIGEVRKRIQVFNPKIKRWIKIDTETKKFIDQMERKNTPFKGVRKYQ